MRYRTRSSSNQVVGGIWKDYYSPPGEPATITVSSRYMEDYTDKSVDPVTGRLPESPMHQLNKIIYRPCRADYHRYINEYLIDFPCSTDWGFIEPSGKDWSSLNYNDDVATLLSRTNPFRYEVSVPVMVAELTEVAHLASLVTKNFASLFGSAHLNWNFGVVPFYNDMQKLANITKSLEKRILEFNRLAKDGYVRRRIGISDDSVTVNYYDDPILSGFGFTVYADSVYTYHNKVRGACTWRIRDDAVIPVDLLTDFNQSLAYALDLDLDPKTGLSGYDLSTMWEAIPFSWLVDYFVNVGDVLQAIEESESVYPRDISITRECTLDIAVYPKKASWWSDRVFSCSNGGSQWKLKRRVIIGDDPSLQDLLSFGFMSKSQATNVIALLAVLKARA